MTEPTDRQRVELRLPATTAEAAKESAYQRRQSLNAWVQEAVDFYLAHLAQMPPLNADARTEP